MTDRATRTGAREHPAEIIPSAEVIVAVLDRRVASPADSSLVIEAVRQLGSNHGRQWDAEDICRSSRADDTKLAAAKRLIDGMNAERARWIDRIDAWVAASLSASSSGRLHTETLGSVIDRICIAWVRVARFEDSAHHRAGLARSQLAELTAAYDELVDEVCSGERRLPNWRTLKRYGKEEAADE